MNEELIARVSDWELICG